ncbi:MAG: TetR/AcrR family transcriptional regulator [Anaerolineae bacterium]
MPRVRDVVEFDATKAQIKAIARAQMAAHGTAGLSLRAIAREMDVTAPALYRYYPSLDDLITALIVDAYNAIADAAEAGDHAVQDRTDYEGRVVSMCLHYRDWALAHPIDFQLIYGNPIPGYEAPRDLTVPAATRTNIVFTTVLVEAYAAGKYQSPYTARYPLSPEVRAAAARIGDAYDVAPELVVAGFTFWEWVQGAIFMTMFGHASPVEGDPRAVFETNARILFNLRT